MSSFTEDAAMKFLSKKEVKVLTLYSDAHRTRLEAAGRFPKRVRLGMGRYARVAYIDIEVIEWMAARVSERDKDHASR